MTSINKIKCGRRVFDLQDGDSVLDNGSWLQFLRGTSSYLCSKKAFKEYKKNPHVKREDYRCYMGDEVLDEWVYRSHGGNTPKPT